MRDQRRGEGRRRKKEARRGENRRERSNQRRRVGARPRDTQRQRRGNGSCGRFWSVWARDESEGWSWRCRGQRNSVSLEGGKACGDDEARRWCSSDPWPPCLATWSALSPSTKAKRTQRSTKSWATNNHIQSVFFPRCERWKSDGSERRTEGSAQEGQWRDWRGREGTHMVSGDEGS